MVLNWLKGCLSRGSSVKPRIIPRSEHSISRRDISENALKVLYRLHDQGYQAYLVGGGVRDILLGVPPKDFDVVTNATPEQIRAVFRNCRLIGRRFRLAHIHFGRDIIEVATFRAPHEPESQADDARQSDAGVLIRDNVYGTQIADDVFRRDFTVNALYYNIADFSIVDYVGGVKDIEQRTLKLIGSPKQRYREDPVRMLRAVRFASQKGLTLSSDAERDIAALAPLIQHAAPARLFEELSKLFLKGSGQVTFEVLSKSPLFPYLFPGINRAMHALPHANPFIQAVLKSTDDRLQAQKPVTLAFIIAGLYWPVIEEQAQPYFNTKKWYPKLMQAIKATFKEQNEIVQIPKRLQLLCHDIWLMQFRLIKPHPKRVDSLVIERRFRATYDFLCLRAESNKSLRTMAEWWTRYQNADEHTQGQMKKALSNPQPRRRKTHR